MAYLIDTNVWLRLFDRSSVDREAILKAIRRLLNRREDLVVSVQNVAEFWNVTTRRKEANGHGESAHVALRRVAAIERLARVVYETESSYAVWRRIVVECSVQGVAVHDARLASVALSEGISHILTLNVRDFRRYRGIVALTPDELPAT